MDGPQEEKRRRFTVNIDIDGYYVALSIFFICLTCVLIFGKR